MRILLKFSTDPLTAVGEYLHGCVIVVKAAGAEEFTHLHYYSQFFADFPGKAVLRGFPLFDLPSGELPFAGQPVPRTPLGKEELSVPIDHRGCHKDLPFAEAQPGKGDEGPDEVSDEVKRIVHVAADTCPGKNDG